MSKDPAFLLYSSDFLTGTMTMTNAQVGQYMRLICLQHQRASGRLTEQDMLFICPDRDEIVFSKFKHDENGFYNERLSFETQRRTNYCESRRKARLGKHTSNMCKTYVKRMENENETVNENNIEKEKESDKRFVKPTIEEIGAYFKLIDYDVPNIAQKFFNYYEANGWKVGKNKMKNWHSACQTWKINAYDKQDEKEDRFKKELNDHLKGKTK
jgi:hypothetical protein